MERLGLPANRCMMVGDRLETDILMGQQAGMYTAAVLTWRRYPAKTPPVWQPHPVSLLRTWPQSRL